MTLQHTQRFNKRPMCLVAVAKLVCDTTPKHTSTYV
jgi:hypothetical protein